MRTYIASPITTRAEGSDIPLFRVTVADNVCATEAYSIIVPDKDNRYITALSLHLTDEEMDFLIEALAAARFDRLRQQEAAFEKLSEKFAPKDGWDNAPIADRTDPDGDFPEVPVYTDADAPEGDL